MDWLEIWAIGVYDYRLSAPELWSLTPAQFLELGKRNREKHKHEFFCSGIVASTIVNLFIKKGADPYTPLDFTNWYGDPELEKQKERARVERLAEKAKSLNTMFGGRLIKRGSDGG